ncbi:LLM class flavin-dependent oxidoreductase [Micrococcus sp.]|uniref:LLM class flavin-dependent oxidoreductase n=1 Tax=Micrococcus sp. TaxID=1271 RepID=UPI002A91A528|nr:LLM class flavin-dependent oxidoreductase [Micrococcus sp.]MDY6054943.1 LLM class flavin-dependent oxidoreductase [Micrococcus sp.]
MTTQDLQFGIDTFGDRTATDDGTLESHAEGVRHVVDLGVAAEEAGLDAFNIGEHHRDDYTVSSPELVLAAIAARTERIRLGTAVTVLSSDDPVRVYERFATLDALSSGRAEVILGRGSFTESFPLFGYSLNDYESLFEEKLALFAKLRTEQPVTWTGQHTQNLHEVTLYPPLEGEAPLPTWVAVGGSPQSVVRAANYDLPLMLAIIGGPSARFAPFAKLYRDAREKFGHEGEARIGFHMIGHVAETNAQAFDAFAEPYLQHHARIGQDRGWPTMTTQQLRNELGHGLMAVGSPETVARKVAQGVKDLGAARVDFKVQHGPIPHAANRRSVELFGEKVVPLVKDMLAGS